uniref:Protein TIC 214 n=1 Tax=Scoliosorus ensiformis TaxID=38541 RepID=A0A3G5CUM8_9MONI|nr:hypothetical protein [Scoliosorus ensiformis]AYW16565.1 hypothetical protein [Scoliosorus ensiformis]
MPPYIKEAATNTSLFLLKQLPCPNLVHTYILLGLYYGLLTTFPVGPPQILFLRSFLLGGNLSGFVSLSGLFLAQLIIILSIYWSPIYLLLSRPHLLTLVSIPYMVFFCLILKDFPSYHILRPALSLRDLRLTRLFLLTFLFQILNPIMLPNPVWIRLIYLNLFRYSTKKTFLIASFIGWLLGQVTFIYLSRLLLTRVEKDSPILYLFAKRSIYLTFSIVFIYQGVACLGRAPISFWTKKFLNEADDIDMSFWDIAEYSDLFWWFFKPWPTSFFDPARTNRSNRFVKNSRSDSNSSFYKARTSTYFFGESLTDGKERLSFTALPSLSIFERWVYRSMTKSPRSPRICLRLQDWMSKKLTRTDNFQKDLIVRLKELDTRSLFSKTTIKRTRLTRKKKRRIPRPYDPLVNKYRIRIPVPQPFLLASELSMATWEWTEFESKRNLISMTKESSGLMNTLKDWIYAKKRKSKQVTDNPLPWELLPSRSQRIFQFLFKKRVSYDYEIQTILKKIKSSSTSKVTWEEILNLEYEDQILFLIYLQDGCCYQIGSIFPTTRSSLTNLKRLSKLKNKIRRLQKAQNLCLDLARNIALYFENEIDVPGVEGDFRHRKLRNVGVTSAKGKPKSLRFVKRYARISDFRRRLFKGSMRSRRRKTLLWRIFQDKIRSPFFLRSLEKPILRIKPREKAKIISRFTEIRKPIDFGSETQLVNNILITSPEKKGFMNELKLVRSAVAARSDIGSIHNGRGYLLIFQSKFRKFIKIPVLIVFKSVGRMLFRQRSEWTKDWTNWRKEVHIHCTFDGEEFSQEELPPRWLREGIQIKLIYPFHLKPWHKDKRGKQNNLLQKGLNIISKNRNLRNKKRSKIRKPKFTYLTVLGYQTDLPFGTLQKETPFWKPVRKKLNRICKQSLFHRFKHVFTILDSWFNWERVSKENLSSSKKIHHISKLRQSKETPFDYDSTEKHWMRSLTPARNSKWLNNKKGLGQDTDIAINNSRSIAIGGEMHSVNLSEKGFVSSHRLEEIIKKLRRNDFVTGSAISFYKITETDELDLNRISHNSVPNNPMLTNGNLIYTEKPDWNQPIEIKESLLSLYLVCRGFFERFVLTILDIYHTIDKVSNYSINEFIAFYIQLQRVLHDINCENNLVWRNLLLRLQKSSQASLYAEFWDIGLMSYLNLDMLICNDKNVERYIKKNQCGNGCNNGSSNSNLQQPKRDIENTSVQSDTGIDLTQFRSSVRKTNYEKPSKMTNQFVSKNVTTSVEIWGFLNRFKNFSETNWNEWLDYLHKYKVSLSMWYKISPQKWKADLSKRSITKNTSSCQSFPGQSYSYSLYGIKSFFKHRIGNFIKLRKHRNILYTLNDSVQNGDIQDSYVQQAVTEQEFHHKSQLQIKGKRRKIRTRRFVHVRNLDVIGIYNLQFNLISWLNLTVARIKIFSNFKKQKRDSLLADSNQYDLVLDISGKSQKVVNELYEIMLDEREDADFIFRWKWKFELELERINNLIALARTLGDEHDLVTLCLNTEIDSDLLNFYFDRTKLDLLDTLSIVSSNRLSLIFDDQDLLFKILQPILRINSIFKVGTIKHLNRKIYNTKYISNVSSLLINWKHKKYCISNIDDLLLPRRRWEFRFLRCLLLSGNLDMGLHNPHSMLFKIEQTRTYKKSYLHDISGPIGIHRIKRFLWPSSRLEEIACISRFCLGMTNGNQFAALRIRMYPSNQS